jgi:uncharacterized OsmC-like protein
MHETRVQHASNRGPGQLRGLHGGIRKQCVGKVARSRYQLDGDVETGTGRTIAFDDVAEGGLGPVETVLAALAACTAMDVISIALKKRQPVLTYKIHARGEKRDEYPQIFTRIDLVHEASGMNAVQTGCDITRCWRDVHTITQHVVLAPTRYEVVGRVMLGLEPGSPLI